MAKAKKPTPIRLSNRTAISLRKSAQRVRGAWMIAIYIFALLCVVLAAYLGLSWLPAVPLTLLAAAAGITLMWIISRSQYLMLVGQAICTEAASRQMEERVSDQKRRRRAIEELAVIRADLREAEKKGVAREGRSEEAVLFDLLTGRDKGEEEIRRQRRSEEDEELYAANYRGQTPDADEDLYPPRPQKKAKAQPAAAPADLGGTRVMKKAEIQAAVRSAAAAQQTEDEAAPRRRRRSAQGAQAAPLQLIRNDRAQ